MPTRVSEAVQYELVDRAGRSMFERIWEVPRRLGSEADVLSGKFALYAAWPPGAIDLVIKADGAPHDSANWKNELQLEHVVPAGVIYWLISKCSELPKMTDKRIADMLAEITTHLVVPSKRGPSLAQSMSESNKQKLFNHYTGVRGAGLSNDEVFDVCWSRYLEAKKPLGFGLDEIRAAKTKPMVRN